MATEQITLSELAVRLDGISQGSQGSDYTEPLRSCSTAIKASAKENFAGGHGPDGEAWAPLARPRKRTKGMGKAKGAEKDKPLRDTGLLMASLTAAGPGHVERLTRAELLQGTNLGYARYHQYGTRHIPARPFLGFNEALQDRIVEIFGNWWVKEMLKKL